MVTNNSTNVTQQVAGLEFKTGSVWCHISRSFYYIISTIREVYKQCYKNMRHKYFSFCPWSLVWTRFGLANPKYRKAVGNMLRSLIKVYFLNPPVFLPNFHVSDLKSSQLIDFNFHLNPYGNLELNTKPQVLFRSSCSIGSQSWDWLNSFPSLLPFKCYLLH